MIWFWVYMYGFVWFNFKIFFILYHDFDPLNVGLTNIDFVLLNGYASLGVFMIKSVFKVRSMIPSHTFQKFVLYLIWQHK